MPKFLPDEDFRARRRVLLQTDFAYAPKPESPPSDMIDEETWREIVTLPDDVAVRTSNFHGTTIKKLADLWSAWIECCDLRRDFMNDVMLDSTDDFQCAQYLALTGFYRNSIAAVRSAVELITIGTWAQACRKKQEFRDWRARKVPLSLGIACDGLIAGAAPLRKHLASTVNDTLFDQKTPLGEGGFVRRSFSGISEFSHGRPGFSDGDMRQSNGPIYVRSAFEHAAWIQFEMFGLAFVLLLIARPGSQMPPTVVDLFADANKVKSRVTRAAFEFLHP